MIKKLIKIFSVLFLLSGCGFKVQDQSNLSNFYIEKINTTGDNRVNFNIKNKLFLKSGTADKEPLSLKIETIKTKNIKEKNDKNIITKYVIKIDLKITVEKNGVNRKIFNLSHEKDYGVGNQYSQTVKNEKQAIKDITEILINKIIRQISNIDE